MILGTAGTTIVSSLNATLGGFTLLFYLHNRVLSRANPMRDLAPVAETDRLIMEV